MNKPPHKLGVSPIGQPPPGAGAVDLSLARDAAPEMVALHRRAQNVETGFLCQCGERMRENAHQIFMWRERALAGPQGALPAIVDIKVHSLSCPIFYEMLNDPMFDVFGVRRLPPTLWMDELGEETKEMIFEAARQYKEAKEGIEAEANAATREAAEEDA